MASYFSYEASSFVSFPKPNFNYNSKAVTERISSLFLSWPACAQRRQRFPADPDRQLVATHPGLQTGRQLSQKRHDTIQISILYIHKHSHIHKSIRMAILTGIQINANPFFYFHFHKSYNYNFLSKRERERGLLI